MSRIRRTDNDASESDESVPTASMGSGCVELGGRVGPYRLLSILGEGGYGVVYLAEQRRPVKRHVALKVIKPGMDTKQVIARFEAERQALALLDHPNVAHVFEAGTTERGRPYFVMELVKGLALTEHCDRHKLDIEERLRLFAQVCEAVHHAHQKGIIHRDIKPSNILVSFEAQKAVPRVIDFGVAKAISQPLTDRTLHTEEGQFVGTPEYMSPEQAELTAQDIDTRSDIYSLGVVLYELLIGALPFDPQSLRKGGVEHIRKVISEQEPETPHTRLTSLGEEAKTVALRRRTEVSALAKRLHRELEWIPLKAMRKDRTRRYRSASEFADDIRNYLDGAPLIAGPETASYKVKKFVSKHAGYVATVSLVAGAILVGFIATTAMYFRSESALKREALAHAETEDARAQVERAHARLLPAQSHVTMQMEAGGLQLSVLLAVEAMRRFPSLEADSALRRGLALLPSHVSHRRHAGTVGAISFSPDGNYLATADWGWAVRLWEPTTGHEIRFVKHGGAVRSVVFNPDGSHLAAACKDGTLRVLDPYEGEELLCMHHDADVRVAVFSPDPRGKYLMSASADKTARIWDANNGDELERMEHRDEIWTATISPDGKHIATASRDDTAGLWDWASGKKPVFLRHRGDVFAVAFSPNGKYLATGSLDNTARIWDVNTAKELTRMRHEHKVACVAFSPNGKYLATGSGDGATRIWGVGDRRGELARMSHETEVLAVAFSPDGKYLATASMDKTGRLWRVPEGKEVARMCHRDWVWSVAFSPDGRYVVTGSRDREAHVWEMVEGEHKASMNLPADVYCVTFDRDGKRLASASADRTVRIWDSITGEEIRRTVHDRPVRSIAFSPNGKLLATAADDGNVKVFDVRTGKEALQMKHEERAWSVTFSTDGRYIASAGQDNTVRVWEADSGDESALLPHGESDAYSVAFGPHGKYLATGDRRGIAHVWDWRERRELRQMVQTRGNLDIKGVRSVAFSPNGKYVGTACRNGTAQVWEWRIPKRVAYIDGHGLHVTCVSFSPDGKHLATASHDRTARVWEWETGIEIARINHGHRVQSVAFSPDGRYLATGCMDKTIRIHHARPESLVAEAQARLARNLTHEEWKKYLGHEPYNKTCPDLPIDPMFVEAGRKSARDGDIDGALAIFRRAVELEPGLDLDPEEELRKIAHAATPSEGN